MGSFLPAISASRKELIASILEYSKEYWISSLSGVLADIFVIDGDYITWPSNYTNIDIRRIRLDISGNLTIESGTSYGSYKWDNLTTCGAYPACGDFSVCNEAADETFKCYCLPGFKAYPDVGCMRNTYLCGDGVQKDGFLRMSNVFLPTNHQHWYHGRPSECESDCSKNCSCTGYAYDKEHRCLVWNGTLLNMKQFLANNTFTNDFYLKLAQADLAPEGISVIGDFYCFSGLSFLYFLYFSDFLLQTQTQIQDLRTNCGKLYCRRHLLQ